MLNCSIRQQNPILVEAVNSFVVHPRKSLVYPVAILRMDSLPKSFAGRYMLLRIQSENSEHFLGAVEHLLATDVPCPTAGMGQLLRFSQIGFTSHQGLFGALALGQIEHECDAL